MDSKNCDQFLYSPKTKDCNELFWEAHLFTCVSRDLPVSDYVDNHSTSSDESQIIHIGCRRRKPANPTKSASGYDPNFKGVAVRYRTKVTQDNSELSIKTYYR